MYLEWENCHHNNGQSHLEEGSTKYFKGSREVEQGLEQPEGFVAWITF